MPTTNDTLVAHTREKTGTTNSDALRRQGKLPAVLYGHGSPAVAIALEAKAFDDLLHSGGKNRLLELVLDGKNDTALIRDVQRDPISRRALHADLQRVSATEEISASLPLVTVGVADGVRNGGGVMDVLVHAIDVLGPANALPEHIEVDVSTLGVHQHLAAGDLVLPGKLRLDMDPAALIVAIEPSRTEAEATESAPPAAETEVPLVVGGETAAAESA
jgi:large subunit ribosomal protein L25